MNIYTVQVFSPNYMYGAVFIIAAESEANAQQFARDTYGNRIGNIRSHKILGANFDGKAGEILYSHSI